MKYAVTYKDSADVIRFKGGIDLLTYDLALDDNLFMEFIGGYKLTVKFKDIKYLEIEDEIIMEEE